MSGVGTALVVPATCGRSDVCKSTAPHPPSSHSAKMHRNIPSVIGQTPTKFKGSRAVPQGHRATALVEESTQTGDTIQGHVKPKRVCKVNQVPAEKLS